MRLFVAMAHAHYLAHAFIQCAEIPTCVLFAQRVLHHFFYYCVLLRTTAHYYVLLRTTTYYYVLLYILLRTDTYC